MGDRTELQCSRAYASSSQWGVVPRTLYLTEITLKPTLHGLVQGGISAGSGGDFTQGFLSGAFSSVTGPLLDGLGKGNDTWGPIVRGIAGGAVGAGGAALVDRDVALGAIQGAFVQLFNDSMVENQRKAEWRIEKGGLVYKDVVIGLTEGDRIYLNDEYGGGWIPASLAKQGIANAGNIKDLRLLSVKEQQEFMKFSFDRMKEGQYLGKDQFADWVAYKFNQGFEDTARGTSSTLPKIKNEVTRLVNEGKLDAAAGLVARFGLTVGSNSFGELAFVPTHYFDASKALKTSSPLTIVGAGIEAYGRNAGNNIANFIQDPSVGAFYDLADTITEASPMIYGALTSKLSLTQKLAGFKPIGSVGGDVVKGTQWNPINGPGRLGADLAHTFRSATYVESTLTADTVF